MIEQIKQQVNIIDLAEKIGFELVGKGNTVSARRNVLRNEKSSSIKFYRDSNSYHDFGDGTGGSVIDLYMNAYNVSLSEAIKNLSDENGIENTKKIEPRTAPMPSVESMKPEIVRKIFDKQTELDFTKHKKHLLDIAPQWVYDSATEEDIQYFTDIVRKSAHDETTMILLRDEHNIEKTIRYRRKMVGEYERKYVALSGTTSNFLYTRLTENPLTIVTEGTSDYLVAILLGFSVISLPSASFKGSIPLELTSEREIIFIGDDGEAGQEAIDKIFEETVCNKKRFNYEDFREKYNLKGEDFKDLVCEYDSVDKFKSDLAMYIGSLATDNSADWQNIIKKKNHTVTREKIKETENMYMLLDDVLPHNQITTFVGQPNVGKSALTFAIINRLFEEEKIQNVIYFDADNPLVYTKERILKLMDKNGDDNISYYTGSTATKAEMLLDLQILTQFKDKGKETLIVIDSLKNFIEGSINDDKSINPMFDILQQVRDVFGATVIVLHHTRKGKDEDGKLNYVGSQVIEASSDNMTYLSRVQDTETMILENTKARALLKQELAFSLDFKNMEFDSTDLPVQKTDDESIIAIKNAMGDNEYSKTDLIKKIGKITGIGKNKIGKLVDENKEEHFQWVKNSNVSNGWLISVKKKYKDAVYENDFKIEAVEGII